MRWKLSCRVGEITLCARRNSIVYPPRESNRDRLCGIIDTILAEQPKDFEVFLQKLRQNAIMPWAIPSRRRKRGWPKSPCRASQVGILRLSGKRFEPSIQKKRKILIPTWVYSCCVRHEENRSENCRIVFPQMGVSRMGYGYCNIIYGQIRQKSLIFFVYL